MSTTTSIPVTTLRPHVALNVASIGASVDFYRRLFGLEPAKEFANYAKFDVANPPLNLTLNLMPKGVAGELSHLGIEVASTDDVVAVRDAWKGAGLDPRDEMATTCCYAVQDKAWVSDPDGNEWEVFTVLGDSDEAGAACCGIEPARSAEPVTVDACCTPGEGCC